MKRTAFTLVELLVVIAIIGLLSTVAVVALNGARVNARNTQRKANLIQISKALELYYAQNSTYPFTGVTSTWRGDCSVYNGYPDAYVDATHDAWIPGLTPTFLVRLPHDPNTNVGNFSSGIAACQTPGQNCYIYTSNGLHYKLLSHCAPEGTMVSTDPFYDSARPTHAWQITDDRSVTAGW